MAPYTPIGVDPTYHQGAQTAAAQQRATGGYNAYNAVFDINNYLGPVGYATAATYGSRHQADITAAAVGATANYPGRYSGGALAYGGRPSSLVPGGPPLAQTTEAGDLMETARQQLAASQAQSLALIGIQQEQGMIAMTNTSLSTLMNQRDNMAMSIIRNMRTG